MSHVLAIAIWLPVVPLLVLPAAEIWTAFSGHAKAPPPAVFLRQAVIYQFPQKKIAPTA